MIFFLYNMVVVKKASHGNPWGAVSRTKISKTIWEHLVKKEIEESGVVRD